MLNVMCCRLLAHSGRGEKFTQPFLHFCLRLNDRNLNFYLNRVRDDRLRARDDNDVRDGDGGDDVRVVRGTAAIDAGDVGEGEAEHDPHHAHPRRGLPRMLDALLRHLPLVCKFTPSFRALIVR